jgi:hypothetical protein
MSDKADTLDNSNRSVGAQRTLRSLSPTSRPSPLLPADALARMTQEQALQQPDQRQDPSFVPPGLDTAAFVAGERAAYARAFAAVLPAQQALGQLFAAIETLHSRLEEDANTVRKLIIDQTQTSTELHCVAQRFAALEESTARSALMPEVAHALQSLRDVLVNLSLAQQGYLEATQASSGHPGLFVRQVHWLATVGVGWATTALSKADVAALFLSRKILVGDFTGRSQEGLDRREGYSTVLAATMLVAVVELGWQLHARLLPYLPKTVRKMNAPLQTGLKVARFTVWAAAFVLCSAAARQTCVKLATGWHSTTSALDDNVASPETSSSGAQPGGNRTISPTATPAEEA